MPTHGSLVKSTRKMPFFARNDDIPILVAAVMGLQHCFRYDWRCVSSALTRPKLLPIRSEPSRIGYDTIGLDIFDRARRPIDA